MSFSNQLYFLATFPDPKQLEAPHGGYRRNMEMLRLLTYHYDPTLVIAATRPYHLETPQKITPVVLAHTRMPLRWLKLFKYLYTQCSKHTPLICYNPTLHTLPALWLSWLRKTVIVDYVDIQGTVVESENPLLRRLSMIVEQLFIRTCRHFVTSSTAIADRIHKLNPTANVHIYRGTFQTPENLQDNATHFNLPSDVVKIMYLGMMQDFSGVRELLHAFINLSSHKTHLYIVGHGPMKEECIHFAQKYAPDRIFFPELDDEVLHPFMCQMDILVIPYLDAPRNHVNFPSKIIEYLWAGKAILGTKVGEIQYVLQDKQTALLVPPDEVALATGMEQLVKDPILRQQLGINARIEFDEKYSPQVTAQALNTFIANTHSY
ncbi:MAG: glycosyltransferase [Anaerolineae bacterium]|nr:glycosyltransferase [Anaerolineae bacterium]